MTSMTESDGIDEDLYGADKPQPDSVDEEEAMKPADLVDLKVLTGKDGVAPKVGDECVIKVVAIHGDQAQIEYASEKSDDKETESKPETDSELESLNSEY